MAFGRELTPEDVADTARLKKYWAFGEGRQKWANSPHPYTTLVTLLEKYVSPRVAKGLAANIFHMAFGIWPGERKGENPLGPG